MDAKLVIFNRAGQRKDIDIRTGTTIIGRRPECDVRVQRMLVSRKHCRLVNQEGQVLIQDLGSANGTFVNRERVMEAEVSPGDVIMVGGVNFVVQIDGNPAQIKAPKTRAAAQESGTGEFDDFESGTMAAPVEEEKKGGLADLEPLIDSSLGLDDSSI